MPALLTVSCAYGIYGNRIPFRVAHIVVLNGNCQRRTLVSGEFDEVHRPIDLKVLSGEESREMRKMINENCGNDSRYCEAMPADGHRVLALCKMIN